MSNGGNGSFLKRMIVSAIGVLLGSYLLPGISYDDNVTLLIAVLLLALFSAILKPLLVFMALPFVVVTMGLGLLVINALLYMFVGYLVEGFYVAGFWSAFFGAFIITVLNMIFAGGNKVTVKRHGSNSSRRPQGPRKKVKAKDDVIDV